MPLLELADIIDKVNNKAVVNYQDNQYLTIRQRAIKEAAQELGIKSGLAWASKIINARLEKAASYLDQIYNFNAIVLESNVLPPVIFFGDQSLSLDGSEEKLRVTGVRYEIAQKARFYTALPSWRDYLIQNYIAPEWPNKALLPENSDEKKLWVKTLAYAWLDGISQAEEVYKVSLGRLTLTYKGMLLYHQLVAYHMITPIHVKKVNTGVTMTDNQMIVDDNQWYVDTQAKFNKELARWQPYLVDTQKANK
ncbi:type IV secretory system conjugative DNA transfer family protein [Facilibium subflavum]|uniref:type IV secretory system conjugative DNA transfer family protein n=1 Tax=Facilibium subflavum TaxID=2219058 RepID=UPI000E64C2DB|nr:type IV secretory system conjugative DNA transfer family protein [Facilibium subflavum]